MLPTTGIHMLAMTVTNALDLSAEAKLAHGYACLLAGLCGAEEVLEEGLRWAKEGWSRPGGTCWRRRAAAQIRLNASGSTLCSGR
jgi:hypothetical protein